MVNRAKLIQQRANMGAFEGTSSKSGPSDDGDK